MRCARSPAFAERHDILVAETQAGKSALPHDHPLNMGAIGVTGTSAANTLAAEADLVLAVGTRLQDFTTGSCGSVRATRSAPSIGLNVQPFDAGKQHAQPLMCDAQRRPRSIVASAWELPRGRRLARAGNASAANWVGEAGKATAASNAALPSDAQVIGAVQRASEPSDIVVCAAGGLPGELHKLWNARSDGRLSPRVRLLLHGLRDRGRARRQDGAARSARSSSWWATARYLMMNSEIATSVMLGLKLIIVVLDNRGFGCIDRLQRASGGESFNNLLADARTRRCRAIDFAAHAASLGATPSKVAGLAELEAAVTARARASRPA